MQKKYKILLTKKIQVVKYFSVNKPASRDENKKFIIKDAKQEKKIDDESNKKDLLTKPVTKTEISKIVSNKPVQRNINAPQKPNIISPQQSISNHKNHTKINNSLNSKEKITRKNPPNISRNIVTPLSKVHLSHLFS